MDDQNLQVAPEGDDQFYTESPEPVDDRSPFERFAQVFTSPQSAFAGLRTSSKRTAIILLGLLVGIIVNLFTVGVWSASPELVQATHDLQVERLEEAYKKGKMEKEQYEAAVERIDEMQQDPFSVMTIASVAIFIPLGWLIASAIVFAIGRGIGSSSEEGISYGTALSTYLIALMIPLVEKLITSIIMYATGNIKFSFGVDALLDTGNGIANAALGLINPFTIWWVVVLGTGIAIVANAPRGRGIALWGAFYLFITLAFAALGQVFGGFMG